jgi:hypothetical protein
VRALAKIEGEGECGTVLQLTDDAAGLFRDWQGEIEAMLDDGGGMESMRDWGAKLAGATLRLAAVLHCVKHGSAAGTIDGRTIAAAVKIARCLVPHAEAVLSMMLASEETADDDARYVLRWIERHGRREFTKSEAQHHGKRRFPKAETIDPALAELTRRGYIRPKPAEATGPGRPPSPAYEVNPAVFADAKPKKRSQYSQNSPGEPGSGNFGNIGSAFERSDKRDGIQDGLDFGAPADPDPMPNPADFADPGDFETVAEAWCNRHENDPLPPGATGFLFGPNETGPYGAEGGRL